MANTPSSSKLLVVGNGMAGARTVEEILNRGGGERFEITMIGDEPYGNYNRIMLSHVLSGEAAVDDEDLILNPMLVHRQRRQTPRRRPRGRTRPVREDGHV